MSEKRFEILSAEYEREQVELNAFNEDTASAVQFLALAKKHTSFTELTPTMLNEFVEKIIVHEPDRSNGEREQVVDIYLNFIGKFAVPEPEPTPEELAAAEECLRIRNKRREYNQRYYEKKHRLEQQNQMETI